MRMNIKKNESRYMYVSVAVAGDRSPLIFILPRVPHYTIRHHLFSCKNSSSSKLKIISEILSWKYLFNVPLGHCRNTEIVSSFIQTSANYSTPTNDWNVFRFRFRISEENFYILKMGNVIPFDMIWWWEMREVQSNRM